MAKRTLYITLAVLSIGSAACNKNSNPAWSGYIVELAEERMQKDSLLSAKGVLEPGEMLRNGALKYFEPDSNFRIVAVFRRLPPIKVAFRTNTDRNPEYYTFAVLEFKIGDSACSLIAYSQDESGDHGLFIPFRDASNGKETYGGGRYIDLPYHGEQESIVIDFNRAYNLYCHYNEGYSCPVVPEENRLNTGIYAGEKKWHP